MLEVQGERVLIVNQLPDGAEQLLCVLTLINATTGEKKDRSDEVHHMRLVNRDASCRKPDWPLTQATYEKFKDVPKNVHKARWLLHVKVPSQSAG